MARGTIVTWKQQRRLSWCLLSILVVHFLSLCALSPRIHADLLYQAARARHTSVGHCTLPSSAPKPPGPPSPTQKSSTIPAQRSSTIPICCALANMHKATTISPSQIDLPFFLLLLPLSPKATPLAGALQLCHLVPALHSSHPPPLYLLHTVLLI